MRSQDTRRVSLTLGFGASVSSPEIGVAVYCRPCMFTVPGTSKVTGRSGPLRSLAARRQRSRSTPVERPTWVTSLRRISIGHEWWGGAPKPLQRVAHIQDVGTFGNGLPDWLMTERRIEPIGHCRFSRADRESIHASEGATFGALDLKRTSPIRQVAEGEGPALVDDGLGIPAVRFGNHSHASGGLIALGQEEAVEYARQRQFRRVATRPPASMADRVETAGSSPGRIGAR
ncbi:MAG: hypothetical protein ACJAZN_003991 [Planctomycetota bacterium]|jgi:hypothetical protein